MLEDTMRESNGTTMCSDDQLIFSNIYDTINQHIVLKLWLTLSPKPTKGIDADDVCSYWHRDFSDAFKLCENFILVHELNEKDQIHFHIFCSFKSLRNKITFSKVWLSKWYHDAIIKPIWGRAPKHGINYLIKQYDYMSEYLSNTQPLIMCVKDLQNPFDIDSNSD